MLELVKRMREDWFLHEGETFTAANFATGWTPEAAAKLASSLNALPDVLDALEILATANDNREVRIKQLESELASQATLYAALNNDWRDRMRIAMEDAAKLRAQLSAVRTAAGEGAR